MSAEFKCASHDFKTKKIEDWQDHLRSTPHEESGTGNCIICGKQVAYGISDEETEVMKKMNSDIEIQKKPILRKDYDRPIPVLCGNCKKELAK